ncbi:MAG TPA: AraC family transcriptional regulator, partial [Vicinamibacteria bacterium]|nr:AraC family transcriptional regulator [Vicinamibacteria bacterium]
YESGVEKGGGRAGKAAFIRGRSASAAGFGTLMQSIAADDYRGQRVRFSAEVKAAGVAQWAGLWMRVDAGSTPLAFDNMSQRPIKDTRDWERYDVVLDVPAQAQGIAFGLLLSGPGQVWMSGLRLEAVGPDVATTDRPALPRRPNLSFER